MATTAWLVGTCPGAEIPGIPIRVPDGFHVEVVYHVPKAQGSWVAMAVDPEGRLLASDQFGPLYRLTPPVHPKDAVEVQALPETPHGAQGLLWAYDSLYVVANRDKKSGGSALYRLFDRDRDGRFEELRLLRTIDGDGEHGPHAIVPAPDGRGLYLLAGNATYLPNAEQSAVPRHWGMDMPLPHLGQTDGVWRTNRPGGWICRLDPDARTWELTAIGLRNPYDLAFNADGELFTFDADMEWDLGTPWYRPTRVNHVTRGAEFGWRTGSSKWPDYYADSLPAVLDVGESSPTGLTFGYGARFPAKYQRALFMGDWSYGKIYTLHLEPEGSSYRASLEQFLAGSPLPITDLVIRPQDGSLYFLTGGRGTPSVLYRIAYRGAEPTAPAETRDPRGSEARALRHRLEAAAAAPSPALSPDVWELLAHTDRATRYAARLILESQPVDRWADQALHLPAPRARIQALLALARCGPHTLRPRLLTALAGLDWAALDPSARLDLVRVATVALVRWGAPDDRDRQALLRQFQPRFPAGNYELNRELAQLLVALNAPGIVDLALTAMETAPSQEEQLHYALCLRTLDLNRWTPTQRERFFSWITRATSAGGGVTYGDYLHSIRSEAIDKLTPAHHEALRPILNQKPPPDPYQDLKQRQVVREWKVEDLLDAVAGAAAGGDPERGRRIYTTAMCIKCHRFNRQGGLTGPDLTGVANRFDDRTLLESILEPSKVVSDQYATVEVNTHDGESYTGRIGDQNDDEILLKSDLLNPANIRRIARDAIESVIPSSMSLMPPALLDAFSKEEILDLIAYLKSGKAVGAATDK